MNAEQLLSRFSDLQLWSANGQRAPHKPLLVLWAVGRCLRGEERFVSYMEADKVLTKLLAQFGPHRKVVHTEAPFWRLQNDGVWEVPNAHRITVGPGGNAHKSSLLRENAHAGFPRIIQEALQDNEELAFQLATKLVDAHFPPSIRKEVLHTVGIEAEFSLSRRRRRDSLFSVSVLRAYDYRCAVCDFAVRLNDDPVALEAAHIRWHQARGPDEIRNGLALCALHHRLFDKGAFTVSREHKVMVAKSAAGRGFDMSLGRFEAKTIVLPKGDEEQPEKNFLNWHAREVFASSVGSHLPTSNL